ncbi:hypothetical protein [Janthinobacterium fluminis]|uniref:Apea-like HEPN domain-containing protein n=1 Tax=Janthinobacterium fluminis TaxID=2987524 RepID=A0ABT5K303_9BURK|nr:hypothetical protein [Janthinobacterium fluminis]MDC8758127.1 hypothetical protein [Janthinobacterium fluminis]
METDLDSLNHFVHRWLDKAGDVSDSTDFPFVDRFVFTYISFNALYTAAANVLDGAATTISTWSFRNGGPPKRRFKKYPSEQKRATALVVDVIGRRRSAESLVTCKDAIEDLCDGFGIGRLYLHELENGEPDTAKDNELITLARSGDTESVLKIVYLLRCNLFHGAKALSGIQDVPLTAATTILRALIPSFLDGVECRLRSSEL